MMNKALVIQNSQSQSFDCNAFLSERNLVAEYYSTRSGALSAFKTRRYRLLAVSMDLQNEDPLAIIRDLRSAEIVCDLPPTLILVVCKMRQPTQSEVMKFNIGGQIRLHRLP